jgi:hypothetical protein
MARSKQTKATATSARPATTSSRRTQASTPTKEDPPAQGSRPLRTSKAAKSQAAEKAREIADELAFQARVEAAVRAVSTVAEAKKGIKVARQAVRNLEDDELGNNTEKNMGRATYQLWLYEQRRDGLQAALPTPQTADDNQDPADSDDNLPSQQRWSPHNPRKYWDIHGITRESKHHYKICWKGTTEDGEDWDDLWVRKVYVCQKAYDDWQRRKGDPRMWKVFED